MDDGSKTLEESVEMLRLAAENGTTDIVASPHANNEFRFDPEIVAGKIAELESALGGSIRIHSGCDFHLSYDNIVDAIEHPTRYTINHKRYILVEFSDLLIPRTTDEFFSHMQSVGMTPIITHPERNMLLHQRLAKLEEWADSGCLLQVTALSLLGRFGKQAKAFSDLLLSKDLVHIVASDAHDTKHRPPLLREAYDYVTRTCGPERAERLFVSNPAATLTGAPIELVRAPEPAPRKWYQFWS